MENKNLLTTLETLRAKRKRIEDELKPLDAVIKSIEDDLLLLGITPSINVSTDKPISTPTSTPKDNTVKAKERRKRATGNRHTDKEVLDFVASLGIFTKRNDVIAKWKNAGKGVLGVSTLRRLKKEGKLLTITFNNAKKNTFSGLPVWVRDGAVVVETHLPLVSEIGKFSKLTEYKINAFDEE